MTRPTVPALWLVLVFMLAPAGAARADPPAYTIDPTHTFVHFEIAHFGTTFSRGRWDRKDGRVTFDRSARSGRAEITIDMASINTGVPAFDRLLRGPEVFDVERFPEARFVGERFVFDGDRLRAVEGLLTLRDRTQPVTLGAVRFDCYTSPLFKREVCGGDFEARLQRSRWGLDHGLPALAPDEVRLQVQVEAIRQ